MARAPHLRIGQWAEERAVEHLENAGLRLLTRNFRCRLGELDAVMADGSTVVFVEVRYRASDRYGDGLESVTHAKQRKLIGAARAWLARHAAAEPPCRFDVVSVTKRNYLPHILWIRDAFGQD